MSIVNMMSVVVINSFMKMVVADDDIDEDFYTTVYNRALELNINLQKNGKMVFGVVIIALVTLFINKLLLLFFLCLACFLYDISIAYYWLPAFIESYSPQVYDVEFKVNE